MYNINKHVHNNLSLEIPTCPYTRSAHTQMKTTKTQYNVKHLTKCLNIKHYNVKHYNDKHLTINKQRVLNTKQV